MFITLFYLLVVIFLYYINNYTDDFSNYKYLVSVSDNYICLTNSRYIDGSWDSPDTIDVCYFYNSPTFQYLETQYTSSSYREFDNISSQITDDFHYSKDFPIIIICSILLVFSLILIFNNFTRLITKGGAVFPR